MYYGYYTSLEGDGSNFITKQQEHMQFPPQVTYSGIKYKLARCYQASTTSQIKRLQDFCEKMHGEIDVEIG